MLGMGDGEAHVIRNAGGAVTDDVVRSLAISQRLLGTREIMLIHHTDCGLQKTTEDEFKHAVEAETGIRPPWAVEAFVNAEQDVLQSIAAGGSDNSNGTGDGKPKLTTTIQSVDIAKG